MWLATALVLARKSGLLSWKLVAAIAVLTDMCLQDYLARCRPPPSSVLTVMRSPHSSLFDDPSPPLHLAHREPSTKTYCYGSEHNAARSRMRLTSSTMPWTRAAVGSVTSSGTVCDMRSSNASARKKEGKRTIPVSDGPSPCVARCSGMVVRLSGSPEMVYEG